MTKKLKKIYLQQKKRFFKKNSKMNFNPRLSIFKSHKHIYAQIIDDIQAHTLLFSSTLNKNLKLNFLSTSTKNASIEVGKNLALAAIKKKLQFVTFDRGNKPYLGRIKCLAETARKYGLKF